MRKSRSETAETRRRIVEAAAEAFRANGIHATGLADVMAAVGLSHGGFYRHFDSKDQLVAEACEAGTASVLDALAAAAGGCEGEECLRAVVDAYLSPAHRDAPAVGCPLAGMGSELVRGDENTRAAAARSVDTLVTLLAERVGNPEEEANRSWAIFALSAMVGALTLARLIADPVASAALLDEVRQRIVVAR
jgi:TetR/AcrR family transcriptional repressor of nem operon